MGLFGLLERWYAGSGGWVGRSRSVDLLGLAGRVLGGERSNESVDQLRSEL